MVAAVTDGMIALFLLGDLLSLVGLSAVVVLAMEAI